MTEKIQISAKLNNGTIVVVGGDNPDEFYENAVGMVGIDGADEVKAEFMNLIPPSGGAQQAPQQQYQPRQGAGSPPGGDTLCPSHQQAAEWRGPGTSKAGNAYQGFWKCPVTGESISFNGKMKSSCPSAK